MTEDQQRLIELLRQRPINCGLRSFPVGEYVIICRIESEEALILRVLRGGRNIAALFEH
jgi:plasmid stabilization system protein ParE